MFTKGGKTIEITRTVRFLDTFRFMPSSLDKLENNQETLPETHHYIPGADKRKYVYPYEYMDSFNKFRESLPPKEAFYLSLNQSEIEEEEI